MTRLLRALRLVFPGHDDGENDSLLGVDPMYDISIPPLLRELVDRELDPGERIEWVGVPKKVLFQPASLGAFLFGIPWTAFAIFWTAGAAWMTSQSDMEVGMFRLFPLFGVPFILVGLGMLSSPFWAMRKAGKTVYVITDRRAITFEGGRSISIRSYDPDKLTEISRREKADGSGDIIFGQQAWTHGQGNFPIGEQGFFRIPNVREVEKRLRGLANVHEPIGPDDALPPYKF